MRAPTLSLLRQRLSGTLLGFTQNVRVNYCFVLIHECCRRLHPSIIQDVIHPQTHIDSPDFQPKDLDRRDENIRKRPSILGLTSIYDRNIWLQLSDNVSTRLEYSHPLLPLIWLKVKEVGVWLRMVRIDSDPELFKCPIVDDWADDCRHSRNECKQTDTELIQWRNTDGSSRLV